MEGVNKGCNEQIEKRNKRKRIGPNKKWTEQEVRHLIEYLRENGFEKFEKPTAKLFYSKFMEQHKIKFKVRNMKNKFEKAKMWEGSTGAGTLNDGETIEDVMLRMCPYFHELEEIFGKRQRHFKPIIITSDVTVETSSGENTLSPNLPRLNLNSTSCNSEDISIYTFEDNLEGENERATSAQVVDIENGPSTSSGTNNETGQRGIYSRTALKDVLEIQAQMMDMKKQKLEMDRSNKENDIFFKQKDIDIRERQLLFEKEKMNEQIRFEKEKFEQQLSFEKEKVYKELELKQKELESNEKLKTLELEMKQKIAMMELQLKYNNKK